ncbi:hypothetical protein NLO413_0848 [Candidatus Neoehrlichia lotoris str. RAC413]|uniref:Uncharacterized protein n=1 Tax=Candidatus Neoehrlichia procyonis str. RAC413 TaxID=1359163 RepID=A0A0F3NN18_9RICK|nr:hypothetical protein NLO413_0848 [Candidatus Neoehrlichia lotoris str. RAC413]
MQNIRHIFDSMDSYIKLYLESVTLLNVSNLSYGINIKPNICICAGYVKKLFNVTLYI